MALVVPCACGKSYKISDTCPACKGTLPVALTTGGGGGSDAKVRELEELLRQKELEASEAMARVSELEKDAATASEMPKLQQQLRQAVAERESLTFKMVQLKEEHAKALAEASAPKTDDSAKKELEDAKLRITENERELRDLEKACEDWKAKAGEAETSSADWKSKAAQAEAQVASARKELEDVRAAAVQTDMQAKEAAATADQSERVRELEKELEGFRTLSAGLREELLAIQEHQALAEQRLRGNETAREVAVQIRSLVADCESELGSVAGSLARLHERLGRVLGSVQIPTEPLADLPPPPKPSVTAAPAPSRVEGPAPSQVDTPAAGDVPDEELEPIDRPTTGKIAEPTPSHGLPAVPAPSEVEEPAVPPAEEPVAEAEPLAEPEPAEEEPRLLSESQEFRSVTAKIEDAGGSAPPVEEVADFDPVPLIDEGGDMKITEEEEPAAEPVAEESAPAEEEAAPVEEAAAEGEEEKQEPPKKRGFFSRLFGKK